MYQILALNKISATGLAALDKERFALADKCENPDAIIVRSAAMHEMVLPGNLLCVARAGAGVNNIPVDKCAEKGVVVFNTPGANANAVKELAVCALMLASRKIVGGISWAHTLSGTADVAKQVEAGKSAYVGPEIMGKTLGVIGLGAIGVLIANAAHSLGMDVVGYDPFLSVNSAWAISRSVRKARSLEEVYAESDYITLHLPYNKETKAFLGAAAIAQMKNGVRILNLARAELVDDEAVKNAILSEKVACYVTDFPTDATVGADGVIAIPHLGASTPESEENCAVMASAQMKDYLLSGNIKNSVNYPDVELPETGRPRVCVLHKNTPGMIGQITTALGGHGVNVDNMISRSKGDYACTLLEVENGDVKAAEGKIEQMADVIRARVIA